MQWTFTAPDLFSCDFFLKRFLKAQVFYRRSQTTVGKKLIPHEITSILLLSPE